MNTPTLPTYLCTTHLLDQNILSQADSFFDLYRCAVPALAAIYEHACRLNQPVVQICGPMTTGGLGDLRKNMSHFDRAVKVAQSKGVVVFNLAPFETPMIRLAHSRILCHQYPIEILTEFYRCVFRSGFLHELWFLPDWQSSFGCQWEFTESSFHRLLYKDYPLEWLPEVHALGD